MSIFSLLTIIYRNRPNLTFQTQLLFIVANNLNPVYSFFARGQRANVHANTNHYPGINQMSHKFHYVRSHFFLFFSHFLSFHVLVNITSTRISSLTAIKSSQFPPRLIWPSLPSRHSSDALRSRPLTTTSSKLFYHSHVVPESRESPKTTSEIRINATRTNAIFSFVFFCVVNSSKRRHN